MGTTTLLSLDQKLLELIGDWKQETVTTALAASTALVCTRLNKWTARDDYYNDWYCYVEDNANAGVDKIVSDYVAASTRISVLSAWTAEASTATLAKFRLSRYSWDDRRIALNDAVRETYPNIIRYIENRTLITSNILPNCYFEDWIASTAIPDFYTASSTITIAANTTAAYLRGSAKNVKATAGAANDYFYITSDNYPRLLDLQDQTVDLKSWVIAESANDCTLTIWTRDKAGSTQSLASTTAVTAARRTLIELKNQKLNKNLDEVQIRFGIDTNAKYVYFDNARITGLDQDEYLIPDAFADGAIRQVWVQNGNLSADPCDDLDPRDFERIWGWQIVDDGSYKYLRVPYRYGSPYTIRLVGDVPLEAMSAGTDTISMDNQRLNMLLEYAASRLFQIESSGVSSKDREFHEREYLKHYARYEMLKRKHAMPRPSGSIKMRIND